MKVSPYTDFPYKGYVCGSYVIFDFNDASRVKRARVIVLEYSAFRAARGLARNPISSEQSIF